MRLEDANLTKEVRRELFRRVGEELDVRTSKGIVYITFTRKPSASLITAFEQAKQILRCNPKIRDIVTYFWSIIFIAFRMENLV